MTEPLNFRRLGGFLLLISIGSAIYVGVGEYLLNHNGGYGETEISDLEEYVLIRVHLFGLFFACIGGIGVIKWQCDNKLMLDHKAHKDQGQKNATDS